MKSEKDAYNWCMSVRRVLLPILAGVVFLSAVFFVIRAPEARAINRQISYQGKLLDSSGAAVADGTYQMRFRLYDAASGGTALWSASGTVSVPTAIPVTVQNGLFTVMLGDPSAEGGWQNTLDGMNWDTDSLYLGVRIASDSEMTPRKRIGAVPQAFNAERLQGMYASSSASGGQTVFAFNQTENNAATSSRTTVVVRSSGTSNANDYLLRGVNSADTTVFALNRQGSVTSTGLFAFQGSGTSTVSGSLSVAGSVSSTVLYAANATLATLGATTLSATSLVWTNATGTNTTSTHFYASLLGFTNAIGTNVTTTSFAVTGTATSTFGGVIEATAVSTTALESSGRVILGDDVNDFIYVNGSINSSYLQPSNDEVVYLGSDNRRWLTGYFRNVTSTHASTTYLYAANAVAMGLSATSLNWTNAVGVNTTSTSLAVTGTATSTFAGSVSVAGNVSTTRAVVDRQFTVNGNSTFDGSATFNGSVTLGDIISDTVTVNAGLVGSLFPVNGGVYDIGSEVFRWRGGYFVNTSSTFATSTYLYAQQATVPTLNATDLTWQNASGTYTTTSRLAVTDGGYFVPVSQSTIEYLGSITATSAKQLVLDDRLLYVVSTSTFQATVFDVDTTGTPRYLSPGTVYAEGIQDFVVQNQVSYVLFDSGILSLNRLYEGEVGTITLSANAQSIFVQGRYAYVTISTGGYYIIDVADAARPRILAQVTDATYLPSPREIYVQDRYAYITNNSGMFSIHDISNPTEPIVAGGEAVSTGRVFVQGSYAYVVGDGFHIVDVFNPALIEEVWSATGFVTRDVWVDGNFAYVAAADGVRIYNVTDKFSPTLVKTLSVTNAQRVMVRGRRLYVTTGASSNLLSVYALPGIEAGGVQAHALEAGVLQVLTNGRIGNKLDVEGGLSVGKNGIISSGTLAVGSSNGTSTIMGNLTVGTSTMDIAMHSQFVLNGNDLFVGGNIGSASSVYTNGAFIAGTGSTYYRAGSVVNTTGNFSVTTSQSMTLRADSSIGLTAGAGVSVTAGSGSDINFTSGGTIRLAADGGTMIPTIDGSIDLGTESNRFDAYLRNATTTNSTTTDAYIERGQFLHATATHLAARDLSAFVYTTSSLTLTANLTPGHATLNGGVRTNDRFAVTFGDMQDFEVYDIASSTRPVSLGAFSVSSGNIEDVRLSERYLYVLTSMPERLYAHDLTTGLVSELGFVELPMGPMVFQVQGRYAYVMTDASLVAIDLADPARMRQVGSVSLTGVPVDLWMNDRYAFTLEGSTVHAYNVADPANMVEVSGTTASAGNFVLSGRGSYAYSVSGGTFYVTDLRVPTVLAAAGSLSGAGGDHLTVSGDYVFVADGNDLKVVDVTNTSRPTLVTTIYGLRFGDILVHGEYLYGLSLDNEFKVYRLPSARLMAASIGSLDTHVLQVKSDGRVAGTLQVGAGLSVGVGGIASQGALVVRGENVTSSFLGNLTVGTSTVDIAMHSQFVMNGDDLFVAGNIGSASSVYTNGAFIAGTGSTYYAAGSITNTTGNFSVTTSQSMTLRADSSVNVQASAGNVNLIAGSLIKLSAARIQPYTDGTVLGSETDAVRFDGYFRAVTSTGRIVQALTDSTSLTVPSSISTLGSSVRAVEVVGDYMYMLQMNQLQIYDVRDKTSPVLLGTVFVGTANIDLTIVGDRAYVLDYDVGTTGALYTINIANKDNPILEHTLEGGNGLIAPMALEVQGRYAYVADNDIAGGLGIFDLGATSTRFLSLTTIAAGSARDVAVVGSSVYLTAGGGNITVYDVSNPVSPVLIGTLTSPGGFSPGAIAAHGGYLYVINLSSPQIRVFVATSTPSLIGSVSIPGASTITSSSGLDIQGNYLYLGTEGSLHVFNVSNPSSPSLIQTLLVDVDPTQVINAVRVSGRYAYVAKQSSAAEALTIVDLGGVEVAQLRAHTVQADTLEVVGNGRIARDLFVDGGLNTNQGVFARGPSAFVVSSTAPGVQFINRADHEYQNASWGAYVDRLLLGDELAATGTEDYVGVITYDAGVKRSGLCLRRLERGGCPDADGLAITSIIADDAITAAGFDIAEMYLPEGSVTTTDVLVFGSSPSSTRQSSGIAYDPHIMGVASTKPAFVLGVMSGVPVALAGRVPTKVSSVNGTIAIGDALTTSEYPGIAMKATKPGMILGYALQAATATSTIEVFVKPGYSAASILGTDGRVARVTDDLIVEARGTATVGVPTQNSWGLTFRGSAWDGTAAVQPSFSLVTQVTTATSSQFVIRNSSSSNVFAIDQRGTATIGGDLVIGGRLYPSGRGSAQQSKYIFLDDTSTSTQYMATNADGWQANDSYDFAERYYSPDKLDMGDLVIASDRGQFHVQRSLNEGTMLMGIVSTKPAFVAGKPGPDTYPIALAGRVPTKVSTMNGAINVGDPLGPSSIPGTAVKATKAGPIVGLALERYDLATVGKIEVFVNPGWWGGPEEKEAADSSTTNVDTGSAPAASTASVSGDGTMSYRGFAVIAAGSKRVHVAYDSVLSYPNVQATPRGQVRGGWWTDNYTDIGFDILLNDEQTRDITFTWSVQGTPTGARVYRSDGTYGLVNPTTGELLVQTTATTTQDVAPSVSTSPRPSTPSPAPTPAPVTESPVTPTTTEPALSPGEPSASVSAPPSVTEPPSSSTPSTSESTPSAPSERSGDSSAGSVATTVPSSGEVSSDSSGSTSMSSAPSAP